MTDPTPYHEPALLESIAAGSETAFRAVFQQYRRKLFSYLYKITGSNEIAEDMLQEVFIDLWNMRARLTTIQNLNAYLHRMAHSKALKGLQVAAREMLVKDRLKEEESGSPDPGSKLLTEEAKLIIQNLVDQLSPAQRRVFLLSREEGLTAAEVAERLELTPNTVRKHLRDAIAFLRDELDKRYGVHAVALYVLFELGWP